MVRRREERRRGVRRREERGEKERGDMYAVGGREVKTTSPHAEDKSPARPYHSGRWDSRPFVMWSRLQTDTRHSL